MPIQYDIDEEMGVIRTTASGRLTDEELLEHKRTLLSDARFRPGMRELSRHQLALLVPTDLVFGMGRMYEQRTEGNTGGVEIFRDEAEAQRWLDAGSPGRD